MNGIKQITVSVVWLGKKEDTLCCSTHSLGKYRTSLDFRVLRVSFTKFPLDQATVFVFLAPLSSEMPPMSLKFIVSALATAAKQATAEAIKEFIIFDKRKIVCQQWKTGNIEVAFVSVQVFLSIDRMPTSILLIPPMHALCPATMIIQPAWGGRSDPKMGSHGILSLCWLTSVVEEEDGPAGRYIFHIKQKKNLLSWGFFIERFVWSNY